MCEAQGKVMAATVVDHIVPHKRDWNLFWDSANWQSLCKRHHDSDKQRQEKATDKGCDTDGMPRDPEHHWNAGGVGKKSPT